MATYRLVSESEWRTAVEAIEALTKALQRAGTVTIPGVADPPLPVDPPGPALPGGGARDGTRLAQQVIERVNAGGQKHQPKVFDRVGPKIADFVYALTTGSFTVPAVIDSVRKYVVLKEGRREAGGQIRTAVRADARFEAGADGKYTKKGGATSER